MISKFPVHGNGCSDSYNFLASQRPAVILWGNEIHARADQTIFKSFQDTAFMITKIKVKVRNRTDCTTAFRRTIAPVDDITLRVQPLYESCEWDVGAPQGIEIAPTNEFHEFRGLHPSPTSIVWKKSWFPNFRSMDQVAWLRTTCLLRNVQPWYFGKMKFKHRRTQRLANVFKIHHALWRKSWSKFETV